MQAATSTGVSRLNCVLHKEQLGCSSKRRPSAHTAQSWQQLPSALSFQRSLSYRPAQIHASLHAVAGAILPAQAAAAPLATQLQFTPVTALVGGLVLGVAAVGKYAITGRILGVSGALKGLVQGKIQSWRVLFTAGMLAGAYIAVGVTPDAFDVLPATYTVARASLGGVLVGLGSAIGNGCTSGHGISGNARLSLKSAVYTVIIIAAGVVVATITRSAAAAGIAAQPAMLMWAGPDVANSGALLLASSLLTVLGLARAGQEFTREPKAVALATELATGAMFAFALVYTGMVRPTKVIGFLSVTHPAWDLTLLFVMAGALLMALPGFQLLLRRKIISKPYCAQDFELPIANKIDLQLVTGAVLFGAGWGLSGICPGPAVVAAAAMPSSQVLAFVAAMLAGMMLQGMLAGLLANPKAESAAA